MLSRRDGLWGVDISCTVDIVGSLTLQPADFLCLSICSSSPESTLFDLQLRTFVLNLQ